MKRFYPILTAILLCGALGTPVPVYALSWDWVPRVWKFENPYRERDVSHNPGFKCKMKNSLGDCVVFNYVPAGTKEPSNLKNYYRRVSSYGGSDLDYSD